MKNCVNVLFLNQIEDNRGNLVFFENNSKLSIHLNQGILMNSDNFNINFLINLININSTTSIICLFGKISLIINNQNIIIDRPNIALQIFKNNFKDIKLDYIKKSTILLITN
jgi:hypothetical protein